MEGVGEVGGQELLARLTESETWPSGDLDTSQVSVSSLPDDEKSEPTTATVSSAAATAANDRSTAVSETVEIDEDLEDETLSPTKFKDLCSKKVSPTKSIFESKIMLSPKLPTSAQLTPEKILCLQELPLSPVKEVSEIETKETCTSPCAEKSETAKPNQLISTRKGFRTRKRLSPIHDGNRIESKLPSRVDRGLSPIAVFTAGPSGVEKEESEYFVQTYDAPPMEEPERQSVVFCSKSTEMSPKSTFETKVFSSVQNKIHFPNEQKTNLESSVASKFIQSDISDETVISDESAILQSEQLTSPLKSEDKMSGTSPDLNFVVVDELQNSSIKVEKSTSPASDMMLDTGIGTDSLITTDTASSPFLLDTQSPSSLIPKSSSVSLLKKNFSTQTIQVEMLSAHTSPIDGAFSLQDSNLSFCPTESSIKSDSLDDLSRTLGTPSSENIEADVGIDVNDPSILEKVKDVTKSTVKEFLEEHIVSDHDDRSDVTDREELSTCSSSETGVKTDQVVPLKEEAINKILVIESFRNVFATEPPFSVVASRRPELIKKCTEQEKKRKSGLTSELLNEERIFSLHEQLLSEESALESSTDSGVDMKETNQGLIYQGSPSISEVSALKKTSVPETNSGKKFVSDLDKSEQTSYSCDDSSEYISKVEQQVLKSTAEYSNIAYTNIDVVHMQQIYEPSSETDTSKNSVLAKHNELFRSENVRTVKEEICIKEKTKYCWDDNALEVSKSKLSFDNSSELSDSHLNSFTRVTVDRNISDVQIEMPQFVRNVEEEVLHSATAHLCMSPTADVNTIYMQQIYQTIPTEYTNMPSSNDSSAITDSSFQPVQEELLVSQRSHLSFDDDINKIDQHHEYHIESACAPDDKSLMKSKQQPIVFKESVHVVKLSDRETFSHAVDEIFSTIESDSTVCHRRMSDDNKVLVSEATVIKDKRDSQFISEQNKYIPKLEQSTSTDATVEEKTQDDGCGLTTHIIQKTTHMTISVQEKPEEGGLQGAASVSSEQEEMGSPKSPELSFAEKRDFFQKLSLSSSSPSTTPTHSLKTNATTEMKTEVYISEDIIAIADSSEEQLSFMERLKFFEKSDEHLVKPEIKEIKKEVWTVVTEDSAKRIQKTDDVFESPEKEREVEIVEIHENIVKSISKDGKSVSLPLYENKEVLETNKDTKVEVTVKKFVPGTEMIEICSVENIPADQDILKENFKAQQLVSLSSTVHQSAKEELHHPSEVGKVMLESKADVDDSLKSKPMSVPPSETCSDEIDLLESKNVEEVYKKKSVIETYETISRTSSEVSSKAVDKSAISDSDKIHQTGLPPSDLSKSVIEPGESTISDAKEVSDEEFISRTYKTILEVSAEVPKATVDAFKKEDKTDKWQRESPDSIKIVKETMEPSLGKSEIFICTEETLDSVKRILSVADAESNIVMSESASTSTVLCDDQQKSVLTEREEREEIIKKTVAHEPEELTAAHLGIDQLKQDIHSKPDVTQREILSDHAEQMASELEKKTEVELKRDNFEIHSDGTISDIVHKQLESEVSREQGKEAEFGKETHLESHIDSSKIKILDQKEASEVTTKESDLAFKGKDTGTKNIDIEKLKSKIENEREIGLHFDESLTRSLGSNEEKSDSCFSSVRDRSIEIEFLPVLEVSGDISKESVDKTGHEALGTPCSFHKQMSVDSRQSDLDQSLEEHEEKHFDDYEIEKKADVSPVGAVEKAEYEEVEKKKQEDIESIIYRESISREKGGKETFHSVEVTQFKEHSTEVYSVPTEKLIEKFPSKKMHFEPLTEDKEPKFLPHKLDQFLDSVTQIDEYGAGISLPSDVAPIHKRTEEWIDQSGELLLKEGAMLDTADNGLFEDRPPTLEDEQHKRSSPTAESFDDKARVEQCDTDVMMQLLDFVSRNDIELAEVRTEDEAPDIEEDVSPSAEEEICTKVSGEESKVDDKLHSKELPASEEKTQECLKVVEAENLLLSPHRSSFDSVTSPSRKDIPSENIDTIVELTGQVEGIHHIRQIMPQSSLEVEIGSRGSDELQLHDIEREVTPLSFVEEEEYIKHSTEVPHDVSKPISESLKDQEFNDKRQLASLIAEEGKLDTEQNLVSETKQEEKKEDIMVRSVDKSVSEEREQEIVDQFQAGENVLRESFETSLGQLAEEAAIISVVGGDTTVKEITEQSVKTTAKKSKPVESVVSSIDDIVSASPDHALESTEIPFAADESELPMDRPLLSTKTDMKPGEEHVQDRKVEIIQEEFVHELKTTDLKHEQYIQPIQEFESELIPCAFVNTAFAGAELIDEVEQSASIRARSPYEVIREEQSSKIDQREEFSVPEETEDLRNSSKISFVSRHADIHRRPILQHIPSEISEEDLVEREITSPIRQDFEVFGEDEIKLSEIAFNEVSFQSSQDLIKDEFSGEADTMHSKKETTTIVNGNIISESVEEICSSPQTTRIVTTTVKKTVIKTVSELDASGSGMNGDDAVGTKLPPHEIELKSETSEYVAKTDDATTPESDTGIPTSPFEVLSESELSDGEHRSAHISMSPTVPKSSTEKSHDSVIMTMHSQSFTDKTISAGISKDFSDSETLNEKSQCEELQLQSEGEAVLPAKLSSGIQHASDEHQKLDATRVLNGPGEVDYHKEYDYDSEFSQTVSYEDNCIFDDMSCTEPRAYEIQEPEDVKKSRYSSISDDGVDMEINEILRSEQQLEDIIERPVTPEPPKEGLSNACTEKLGFDLSLPCAALEDDYVVSDDGDQIVSSPGFSPDDSKTRFAYGIEFEKEILDVPEEAMDIDSDQYSEEKESSYAYAMRFERNPELDEEDIPCYGDLYTHEEEDEDALENGDKIKVVSKSDKDPEFDILAGRKYFSKNVELDDLSMSSLQEFERIEAEIVSGRKSSIGSLDSLNGKPPVSKSGEHDDVSMSSLTEFERLERECTESEKIDPAMQESITQLSEIEEGHESQASETSQENKSDVGKEEDLSIVEDYSNQLESIEEIMLEAKDQLPFQYLIKKTQIIDKSYEGKAEEQTTEDESLSIDVQSADTKIKDRIHSSNVEVRTMYKTSETTYLVPSGETQDDDFNKNVRDDDLDQDSLHDDQDSLQQMLSLKPDSLTEDIKHEFQDSLREEKFDDADSLQGEIPDEMRDSLLEERHIEDDSLRDMDILPDESSLSLESSIAAVISHDSSKTDDRVKVKDQTGEVHEVTKRSSLGSALESFLTTEKAEVIVSHLPKGDLMLSSTDSLEQSSSAAAFHLETDTAMSSSLNSAITSEDYTMISSTDTLEQEGRITFRYEDIPVDELEVIIRDGRQVIVDSEGNIQAQYDAKHYIGAEDNVNNTLSFSSKDLSTVEHPSTSTVQVHSAVTTVSYIGEPQKFQSHKIFHSAADQGTSDSEYESSHFDPDVEVEEIHTTDEFGNPKVIKKIRRVIQTKNQYSSSSSSQNVEEKLKEFLREHSAGESAGCGEEEIKEERTIDDKGNVVLIRTVQQQILSEPQVHSRTFRGPDADTHSREFIETFQQLDPTENVCEYEKIDEQCNVVRVTQQVVVKPEMHTVSFSGPDAHKQMEEYMKQWTAMSQSREDYDAARLPHLFQSTHVSSSREEPQEYMPSEGLGCDVTDGRTITKTIVSSLPSESSEQMVVHTTTTSRTSVSSFGTEDEPPSDSKDQMKQSKQE
ncbi:titin-like [Stegodyphus dumicola]|uniref:titin-like n=1 Tax=Stegodyphus dumicola TaxID=202533 RepID=UPI0015B0742E|nr:titin-like [Stegodyphus dumicola]